MARVESLPQQTRDTTYIDLGRLLSRLQNTLLEPNADAQLRTSSIQRTKVSANVEHARTLLLRLEHENEANRTASQKASIQTDLQQKRAVLKQLQNRLYELNQLDDTAEPNGEDSEETDSDTEELIDRYAPALKHASNSIDTDRGSATYSQQDKAVAAAAAATLSSTLRSRSTAANITSPEATTTGSSAAPDHSKAFSSSTSPFAPKSTSPVYTAEGTNETLLNHHTSEQEALTTSLLTLATALKNSTKNFSETLAASNPVVDTATNALDKSAQGMDAAGKRMGTLRRMTEGKGWLGRMSLYAWVAAGWVVALVVVFVLPKLRF